MPPVFGKRSSTTMCAPSIKATIAAAAILSRATASVWTAITTTPTTSTNALSRSYDIMICDLCGTDEAKMAFMGAPKPLAHWACLQPQRQKDFKALPAEQAIQKIEADAQLEYLMELYRLWLQYPVNTDWEAWRLDAYEHCPGLTTLWYEPFEARYDVADGALVIRFRVKHHRKYCSHDCYIADRYYGGQRNDD